MGGPYSTYGRDETCVQYFGWKTLRTGLLIGEQRWLFLSGRLD